jgi:hypothetical protein
MLDVSKHSFDEVLTYLIREFRRTGLTSGAPFNIADAEAYEVVSKETSSRDESARDSEMREEKFLTLPVRKAKPKEVKKDTGKGNRANAKARAIAADQEQDNEDDDSVAEDGVPKRTLTEINKEQFERGNMATTNKESLTRLTRENVLDCVRLAEDLESFLTVRTGGDRKVIAPFCQAFRDWSSPAK